MLKKCGFIIALLLLLPSGLLAQEAVAREETKPTPPEVITQKPLVNPNFVTDALTKQRGEFSLFDDQWDWLQLTSGEWLKGEFKTLYRGDLEFDSDELDLLTFDFEDVQYLNSDTIVTVRVQEPNGEIQRTGKVILDAKNVTVYTPAGMQVFDRKNIIALVPSSDSRLHYWSLRVSLGFYVKSGNTEQIDYNAKANATRRTAKSRISLDYVGTYAETEKLKTADSQRLSASYDIYVSQKRYFRPIQGESLSDPFQNIDNKLTLSAGYGYYIFDSSRTEWDVSIGPGYQSTRFLTVEPDQESEVNSWALVGTSKFDIELTKTIDLNIQYRLQWADEVGGGYTHHSITAVDFEITKDMDLGFSLTWDRVESPTADEEKIIPEQDDYNFSVNLSYEFN